MEKNSDLLLELLELAAEASGPPPLPEKGIPRRYLPAWIGGLVKALTLPFMLIDLAMQKVARLLIRPPFKRVGSCKRRGNCCHYVLIAHSKKLIGKLFYFWYTQVHGFYKRMPTPEYYEGKLMHVMGCRYLKEDGSCGQYRLRPLICRQWPVIEHFGYPRVLKGCGYSSVPPFPPEEIEDPFSEGHPKLNVLD